MAETAERISTTLETVFQRSYTSEAPDLRRLYENAKRDQWNATRDIDWTQTVDLDRGIFANELVDGHGTNTLNRLGSKRFAELNVEFSCWRLSQLLHGEEARCSPVANSSTWFPATTRSFSRRPRWSMKPGMPKC